MERNREEQISHYFYDLISAMTSSTDFVALQDNIIPYFTVFFH